MKILKGLIKKALVDIGGDRLLLRRSNASLILAFHAVRADNLDMISQRIAPTPPHVFQRILSYFQDLGYAFVSLDDLLHHPNEGKRVAITFDDGFYSVYDHAFPILKEFRAPFTIFFTTAMLGADRLLWQHRIYAAVDRLTTEDVRSTLSRHVQNTDVQGPLKNVLGDVVRQERPETLLRLADELAHKAQLSPIEEARLAGRLYLRPEEVTEMMRQGLTVGAHGHRHWCLETLNEKETEEEILTCKNVLESTFGVYVRHYALPFGRANPFVVRILQENAFASLCTTVPGLITPGVNPYSLPRVSAGNVVDLGPHLVYLHMKMLGRKLPWATRIP